MAAQSCSTTKPCGPARVMMLLSIAIATVMSILIFWDVFTSDRWVYRAEFATSETLIREAEAFRSANGRLPSETELAGLLALDGWKLAEKCPCYRLDGMVGYIVWFDYRSAGASMVYHSQNKSWGSEG